MGYGKRYEAFYRGCLGFFRKLRQFFVFALYFKFCSFFLCQLVAFFAESFVVSCGPVVGAVYTNAVRDDLGGLP